MTKSKLPKGFGSDLPPVEEFRYMHYSLDEYDAADLRLILAMEFKKQQIWYEERQERYNFFREIR